MYLVDTNIISAGAPSRLAPPEIVEWMDVHSASLFLSVMTVAEIEDGIAKLRRESATRKSVSLAAWLETLLHLYTDRILAFDTPTARIAGALSDRARGQGHAPGLAGIIIAATARHHGLTILSRNVRHFAPLGVPVLDPFAELPRA
ncbi:MAG: type II toxin-antitoxin system VapC family toxin [Acetobacteraceae bacterium]